MPRWITYCTTAIAPMIVEGAEIKPAGARRAPQALMAVIIPNDQWSPSQQGSQQGEEEEGEDDWSEFMPTCQVFSAKSIVYEEFDKWLSWWETYKPVASIRQPSRFSKRADLGIIRTPLLRLALRKDVL